MKKLLSLITLSILVLTLASCKGKQAKQLEQNIEVTQTIDGADEFIPDLDSSGFALNVASVTVDPAQWSYIGKKPAVILFYASWCDHCKNQAAILKEVSKAEKSKIDFYQINSEKNPMLAQMFSVSAIPTLVYINTAGSVRTVSGVQPKESVMSTINTFLIPTK